MTTGRRANTSRYTTRAYTHQLAARPLLAVERPVGKVEVALLDVAVLLVMMHGEVVVVVVLWWCLVAYGVCSVVEQSMQVRQGTRLRPSGAAHRVIARHHGDARPLAVCSTPNSPARGGGRREEHGVFVRRRGAREGSV